MVLGVSKQIGEGKNDGIFRSDQKEVMEATESNILIIKCWNVILHDNLKKTKKTLKNGKAIESPW